MVYALTIRAVLIYAVFTRTVIGQTLGTVCISSVAVFSTVTRNPGVWTVFIGRCSATDLGFEALLESGVLGMTT